MAIEQAERQVPAELPEHGPPAEVAHATHTGVPNAKLAMWLFLSSDCLFFGAFIATFLLYRDNPGQHGPTPADVLRPDVLSPAYATQVDVVPDPASGQPLVAPRILR